MAFTEDLTVFFDTTTGFAITATHIHHGGNYNVVDEPIYHNSPKYAGFLANVNIVPLSFTAVSNTGKIVTDDGAGNLIGDVDLNKQNFIVYSTGKYNLYFEDGLSSTSANADYTWHSDDWTKDVEGIFDDAYASVKMEDGSVDTLNPAFTCEAAGNETLVKGENMIINSIEYAIISVQPDITGRIITLELVREN